MQNTKIQDGTAMGARPAAGISRRGPPNLPEGDGEIGRLEGKGSGMNGKKEKGLLRQ